MNFSNKYSFIWFYDSVGSCISIFWLPANICCSFLGKMCLVPTWCLLVLGSSISIWSIQLFIIPHYSSLVEWPMYKIGVSTSILWILKISCSRKIGWEPILFQLWMLARHATPKIQGSTKIVVIKNSWDAFWVNESKYLWNVLMHSLVLHVESSTKIKDQHNTVIESPN